MHDLLDHWEHNTYTQREDATTKAGEAQSLLDTLCMITDGWMSSLDLSCTQANITLDNEGCNVT